eukprot:CAMPEP_0198228770 /NCGR_PEP_ID=MMETSP1445-20131203/113772_1 /TAXON_ID=36898 /ORGANISM="Pyramimonas sp., Strain CCMP2087" /LENGTH=335 /DNA_ID=CAMNT_0043909193 /DNA_START=76 /DNA_END=1083 /DNA_ORIENTATION=+
MKTNFGILADIWIEINGVRTAECSDGTSQISILEYDERTSIPYAVHIQLKELPTPSSQYWGYRFYLDGQLNPDGLAFKAVLSSQKKVVIDTFGAAGDLLAFKNIQMDTEGEGNATDAILKTMGEIRVEVFDCAMKSKYVSAYDPDAFRANFLGEAVSVKEGKKAKEFSTVSVSGGKKAGFQKHAIRPAGYLNVVSFRPAGHFDATCQRGPVLDNLRLKYSRRFTLVVRKILGQEEDPEEKEGQEEFLQRRREKKRKKEAEAIALEKAVAEAKVAAEARAKAEADAKAAATVVKREGGGAPMPSEGGIVVIELSDDDDDDEPQPKAVKHEKAVLLD